MLLSHFVIASWIALMHAAPQGIPDCAGIPTNPDAAQIGAQYLSIPGCSNSSSGGSGDNGGSGTSSAAHYTSPSSTASQPPPTNTNNLPIQHNSIQQQSNSSFTPYFLIMRSTAARPACPPTDISVLEP